MTSNEKDYLTSRTALLAYSRSKISEHIGYILTFVAVIFTLYKTPIFESSLSKLVKINAACVSIFLIGPLIYMVGRTFFWTGFTTAIFRIKHFSKKECTEFILIDEELEEYNLLMAYNRSAVSWVIRRKDIFGRIAKFFSSSSRLIQLTFFSGVLAFFFWAIQFFVNN